jgi:putative nucleotidyltransferase with HDIG domain
MDQGSSTPKTAGTYSREEPLTFARIKQRNIKLPVCPVMFIRLTEALENIDKGRNDLDKIIRTDPVLTAQVLRVCNSAFTGLNRKVHSVEESIFRVGYREVWSIAAALKARELFEDSGDNTIFFNMLWLHSIKTAAYAHALSKRLNPLFSDIYFTAGLLHDIGKLVMCRAERDYIKLCQNGRLFGYDLVWAETEHYESHHARIGGDLLRDWNFPELLADVVALHHEPPAINDQLNLTRCMLSLANEMAHCAEPDSSGNVRLPSDFAKELLVVLGLSVETCVTIGGEAQRMLSMLNAV